MLEQVEHEELVVDNLELMQEQHGYLAVARQYLLAAVHNGLEARAAQPVHWEAGGEEVRRRGDEETRR